MTHILLRQFWGDIRRDCQNYWGKLSDGDLERIGGDYAAFVEALRRRYGFSALKAEDELERFLFRYGPLGGEPGNAAQVEARAARPGPAEWASQA
jgi:hypothetical protein